MQLFDLREDPAEVTDASREHGGEVKRLTKLLREWEARLGDPLAGKP